MIDAGRRADYADAYLLGLLVSLVRPVKKQAILRVRRSLAIGEFQRRLKEVQRL